MSGGTRWAPFIGSEQRPTIEMSVQSTRRDEKRRKRLVCKFFRFDSINLNKIQALQTATPDDGSGVVFVKFPRGKPNALGLWRTKDEAYRFCNRGDMGGWLFMSATWKRTYQKPVEPVRGPIYYETTSSNVSLN